MTRVLFLCSQNRLRSPTAEAVFADHEGLEVRSAGLDRDAISPLTPEFVQWAEIIFVMERTHRNKLRKKFRRHLGNQRIICLGIPDEYACMDPALVARLRDLVPRYL